MSRASQEPRRARRGAARAWLVAGGLLLLAALAVGVAAFHPLRLPTRQPEGSARFPGRDTGHPVVLACAEDLFAQAVPRRPADRPSDLEWANLLTQGLGGCDIVPAAALAKDPAGTLRGCEVLVLPRRTLSTLAPETMAALQPLVEAGLSVLLEMPAARWVEPLGLAVAAVDTAPRLTWPRRPLAGWSALELRPPPPPPLPLSTPAIRYRPIGGMRASLRPVIDMDGRPIVLRADAGSGAWFVIGIDFGTLALTLRQGLPAPEFRLPERHRRRLGAPGRTTDLAACAALLQADVPWLDAWCAALFDPEAMSAPWPVVWPAPFARDGLAVLTHEDQGSGDGLRWMTGALGERRIPTTVFLEAPAGRLTVAGAAAKAAGGAELALQARLPVPGTWRDPAAPRQRTGWGRLRPFERLPGIAEQSDALGALLPRAGRPLLHRSRGLRWPSDVDQGWRWLTGAGMRGDSSYGPSDDTAGWLFGSCVPFHPLDRRGLPYTLWEVPLLGVDTAGGVDRARVERWLRTNASGGHGPVVLAFRAAAYARRPSVELFELWESAPTLSERHNHQTTTLGGLLDFWEQRAQVHLRWEYSGGRLQVEVDAPARAADAELAVALPLRWRKRSLVDWEADWGRARSRRARGFGGESRLFSLPAGKGRLVALYR